MSFRISIPYGAIKRIANKVYANRMGKFQFLMVRLKVDTISARAGLDVISIPYGAIKSLNGGDICDLKLTFQFLMVRLKVSKKYIENNQPFEFQFLMVRLKVKCPCIPLMVPPDFNSLWCD